MVEISTIIYAFAATLSVIYLYILNRHMKEGKIFPWTGRYVTPPISKKEKPTLYKYTVIYNIGMLIFFLIASHIAAQYNPLLQGQDSMFDTEAMLESSLAHERFVRSVIFLLAGMVLLASSYVVVWYRIEKKKR